MDAIQLQSLPKQANLHLNVYGELSFDNYYGIAVDAQGMFRLTIGETGILSAETLPRYGASTIRPYGSADSYLTPWVLKNDGAIEGSDLGSVNLGTGDDVVKGSGIFEVPVFMSLGDDRVSVTSDWISVDLWGGEDRFTYRGDGIAIAQGGLHDDHLRAVSGEVSFFGGKGDDTLIGADGDDYFSFGEGNDFVRAGGGDDEFILQIRMDDGRGVKNTSYDYIRGYEQGERIALNAARPDDGGWFRTYIDDGDTYIVLDEEGRRDILVLENHIGPSPRIDFLEF